MENRSKLGTPLAPCLRSDCSNFVVRRDRLTSSFLPTTLVNEFPLLAFSDGKFGYALIDLQISEVM